MNWKLIFGLSLLGLAMAFATVYVIPNNIAIFLWIAIYIFCAFVIAKQTFDARKPARKYWHAVAVGYLFCIYVGTVHFIFFDMYVAFQPKVLEVLKKHNDTRTSLLVMNIVFGFMLAKVLAVLTFFAGLILKKIKPTATNITNP